MIYSNITDNSRTHFIIISSNYDSSSSSFIGSKINIKTIIPDTIDPSKNCYRFVQDKVFNKKDFSDELFKNRVILSSTVESTVSYNAETFTETYKISLLTQQNLFHNIKFIQKNNDFQQPRILFTKYNVTNDIINTNQYLLDIGNNDLVNLNENEYDILNTTIDIVNYYKSNLLKRLVYYFNIYKPYQNSDYFKFKFSDFIDLSFTTNLDKILDKNSLNFEEINVNLKNDFSNNNLINYNENDFKKLYILDSSEVKRCDFNSDISFDTNILLYNKLDNISTINCKLKNTSTPTSESVYKDMSLNFFVTKGFDYFSKDYGKIYLNKDFIYFNCRVLGYENNFYSNNSAYFKESDNNIVYLSLGNAITGITQKNLYKNMKVNVTNKIYFRNLIDSDNIYSSKDYLLDEDYNYNYTNILNIIIKQYINSKKITLDLENIYHNYDNSLNDNIYNHRFNSYKIINNIDDNLNYERKKNNFIIVNRKDLSLNKDFKIRLIDLSNNNNNSLEIQKSNDNINIISNNNYNDYLFKINYDKLENIKPKLEYKFNNNYDTTVNLNILYSFTYNDNNIDNNIDISYLNFHKIILTSNLSVGEGSDFTNIDCIFIYHHPDSDNTPDEFKYPNNNIQIIVGDDITVDTLNKAIELLPGARTSVTNSIFIPPKNGSNLSKKKIQGLIGLNNTSALLSIKPYDENFIIGRGFINQYQITDNCKSNIEKIEDKLNSQKHISVKNPLTNNLNMSSVTKKKNFANIVRNRKLNQRTQICRTDPASIKKYTTPFTDPLWKK